MIDSSDTDNFLKPTENLRNLQLLEEVSKNSAISQRKLGWRRAGFGRLLPSSLGFLDHHLQGRPLDRPRVNRYVVGEDRWGGESAWPPPGAQEIRLHLRTRGRLSLEAPGGDEPPDRYVYDPEDPVPTRGGSLLGPRAGPDDQRSLAARSDVLCYETAPLASPLSIAGPVDAVLHASTDAEATDFTAKLVHLPRDESRPAINLSDGIRRLGSASSEAQRVDLGLWPVSAGIPAGDRLRVEISSSNFPRYDAHPNVPGNPAFASAVKLARQTIHHAADAQSYVKLYVLV